MTYLSGRTNKRKQNLRRLALVGLFVMIIIFWATFKSGLYTFVEPLVLRYSTAKTIFKDIPEFFHTYTSSRKELVQKDKELEVTIEYLENQIAEKDAQLKELSITTDEMGGISSASIIVMYPLMQDITKIYSTILLSKGYKDGVEKDAYVYVRGLQPVCIIREVYTSTSLCELLSRGGITTEVVARGASSTTISFTVNGRGGGTFLGDVARDTPIAIGDEVFLRSDPSMKIGTVVDVMHNNQDTSWRVFVRGAYNPVTSSIFYIHKK